MENLKLTSEITSITTVTAIEIFFAKEGKEYTAYFTKTETWDANSDHTETDLEIINQIEMPCMTDEEEKELWDNAKDAEPEELEPSPEAIIRIDFPLLRRQKIDLAEIIVESSDISSEQRASLDGVLSLLDALMDNTVASEILNESQVFGEDNLPAFIHPELSSDWNTESFDKNAEYELSIEQTCNYPENFELTIWEDGNGAADCYNYDNKEDAEKDMQLFNKSIDELNVIVPAKNNRPRQFIEYRGARYICRTIKYYETKEGVDFETDSLVSTNTLNDILRQEVHSDVDEISDEAQIIDNLIAFFLPCGEIVDTTPEFVLKCLNSTFKDYTFTYC